ncbi:hypothetical protein PSACC_00012 [Paramicrosporidium saccamoebae]|uniref:Uncharacterized protein n=1 Tax=Paramicrosporidium saccamoebae TaxID=1246581 RepID=A0A2H9TQY6_9FUNG|nr:hypothetical protein PSACC_00012 [Paramicrosporidium saccamoebae]
MPDGAKGRIYARAMASGDKEAFRLLEEMSPNCYRHLARALSQSITAATEASIHSQPSSSSTVLQNPRLSNLNTVSQNPRPSNLGTVLQKPRLSDLCTVPQNPQFSNSRTAPPALSTLKETGPPDAGAPSTVDSEVVKAPLTWFNAGSPSVPPQTSGEATEPLAEYTICGKRVRVAKSFVQASFKNFGLYIDSNRIYVMDGLANTTKTTEMPRATKLSQINDYVSKDLGTSSNSGLPTIDGLIVYIADNRCVIRVFGNPPVSAVILRPVGSIYKPVFSSNTTRIVDEEIITGDVIVVGESFLISNAITRRLSFNVGQDIRVIAKSIYHGKALSNSLVIACKVELPKEDNV